MSMISDWHEKSFEILLRHLRSKLINTEATALTQKHCNLAVTLADLRHVADIAINVFESKGKKWHLYNSHIKVGTMQIKLWRNARALLIERDLIPALDDVPFNSKDTTLFELWELLTLSADVHAAMLFMIRHYRNYVINRGYNELIIILADILWILAITLMFEMKGEADNETASKI